MKKKTLKNVGHRGALVNLPQNSMPAFVKAEEMGLHGLETDIWLTKDGVPIISHGITDHSLEKVFNKSKKITEFIYINDKNYSEFENYLHADGKTQFVSLEEFLEKFKDSKMLFHLEIKDHSEKCSEEVLKLIKKKNLTKKLDYLFYCFNHKVRDYLEKHAELLEMGKINFGYLCESQKNFEKDLNIYKKRFNEGDHFCLDIQIIMRDKDEDRKVVQELKDIGYHIMVYNIMVFTDLEGDDLYMKILQFGGDGFINNKPELLKIFNELEDD